MNIYILIAHLKDYINKQYFIHKTIGLIFALTHFITYFDWFYPNNRLIELKIENNPICWPILSECGFINLLNLNQIFLMTDLYLMTATCGLIFFILSYRKYIFLKWGMIFLVIQNLAKFYIYFSDYRFMGNYHQIHFWLQSFFILFFFEIKILRIFIGLVYFFSGLYKINFDWISGSYLVSQYSYLNGLPVWLKIAVSMIIVLFQTSLVFLLLNSKKRFRYLSYVLIAIFHFFSIYYVGYKFLIYSMPLILILIITDPSFLDTKQNCNELSKKKSKELILLILFSIFQIFPLVYFDYVSAMFSTTAKVTRLDMLSTKGTCREMYFVKTNNYTFNLEPNTFLSSDTIKIDNKYDRIFCSENRIFRNLKIICENYKMIDIVLYSYEFKPVSRNHFIYQQSGTIDCLKSIKYSYFRGIHQ